MEHSGQRLELNPNWSEPARLVKEKWERLVDPGTNPDWMENLDDIAAFADTLRAAYGSDVVRYELWHVFGGSGMSHQTPCTQYDFPGEHSIDALFERLASRKI